MASQNIKYHSHNDLVIVDKPADWRLDDILSQEIKQPLFAIETMAKSISGVSLFAKSKEKATALQCQFKNNKVQQKYWFLTDRASPESEVVVDPEFKRIKRSPFFELWEISTSSSDTNLIRKRARDLRLPILGDIERGGTPFPRLCLHRMEVQIPGEPLFTSSAPRIFERLGLLRDPELCQILTAIDQRQRMFYFLSDKNICLRLLDFECPGLALDLLGSQLWLHWFRASPPTGRDFQRWQFVAHLLGRSLLIQERVDRGQNLAPAQQWILGEWQTEWSAKENEIQFQFRSNQGESHGLFLDQRHNRSVVADLAPEMSVLNLFSYTGGFGWVALKNGASQVTQVDLSRATLDWAKENCKLNALIETKCEDFAADSFFFLERAKNKNRSWDLIICDPPIFSRSQNRRFQIEKNLGELLDLCAAVLSPGGVLLFSTHFEAWSALDLRVKIQKHWPRAEILEGAFGLDYSPTHSLKSYWIFPSRQSKDSEITRRLRLARWAQASAEQTT